VFSVVKMAVYFSACGMNTLVRGMIFPQENEIHRIWFGYSFV
jgi:hypothetical protein